MALIHTIANLKQPFAEGYARRAYYSRKYRVVIKRSKGTRTDHQTLHEIKLWRSMTDEEKTVFPLLNVVEYKGVAHLIMKRCKVVSDLLKRKNNYYGSGYSRDEVVDMFGLDKEAYVIFKKVVHKYDIGDLHYSNLGVDNKKRLVILDAGFRWNGPNGACYSHEYSGSGYDYGSYGDECSCTSCANRRVIS